MSTNATGTVGAATPAPATPQAPVSAFDRMLGFLNQEESPAEDEATAEGESETASPEAESADPATTDPEAIKAEGEEGEGEAESDGEAEAEDQQPATNLFTVRDEDGKERQVDESELIAGYYRHADYTRKTQATASERKELAQEREALVQERQEYAVLLPKLREMIAGKDQEPNWEALRQTDPMRALLEKQRWDEKQARIATLHQEEERVTADEAKRLEAEFRATVAQERDRMLKLPELAHWADAGKRQADAAQIAETLLAAGFSEQELNIVDHRAMLIAHKAALYDKSQKATQKAQASIKGKVDKSPTIKAGASAGKPKTEADRARSRLAKSGSKTDAESWFLHTLT